MDHWQVGVRFDEPVGRSDGYFKGVKIFQCEPRYGGFIRGKNVSVGDQYKVRDLMDEDEDEDDNGHDEMRVEIDTSGTSSKVAQNNNENDDEI